MDTTDGIPPAPTLRPVPLPNARTPQRALEASPVLEAPNASSPFTTTPLGVALQQRTPPPFTTVPLEVALRERGRKPPQYYLTHPPNVLPDFDTRAMTRLGTEVETGYHVLQYPPTNPFGTHGRRRPDTPRPPFRLLTKKPELLEDRDDSTEDASMPPVSPRSPEPETAASTSSQAILSPRPAICSPIPKGWAASNVRLEKLQASAQRCAMATRPSSEADGVAKFVFSVHQSLASRGGTQTVAEEETSSQSSEHWMELDEPLDVVRDGEGEAESKRNESCDSRSPSLTSGPDAANNLPRLVSDEHSPDAVSGRASRLSSISLTSSYVSVPQDARRPEEEEAAPTSSFNNGSRVSRASSPYPNDCRSTRQSPPTQPLFLDESDTDSLPSLQTILSEEEFSLERLAACVSRRPSLSFINDRGSVAANAQTSSIPVNPEELELQLERIARPPSTPANHSWPLLTNWSANHAAFVTRVRTIQNNDAIAFIRQADALLAPHPDILDLAAMQVDAQVDIDVATQDDIAISEGDCTRFAERVQSLRDTFSAYSPGLAERTGLPRWTTTPSP
ncbi:hypothetical protein C8R47DRAFT_1066970 [Mycena vitilis]|nr:hypothetical protein C8R47DRAFT_1066970 [Mycena vitilis]